MALGWLINCQKCRRGLYCLTTLANWPSRNGEWKWCRWDGCMRILSTVLVSGPNGDRLSCTVASQLKLWSISRETGDRLWCQYLRHHLVAYDGQTGSSDLLVVIYQNELSWRGGHGGASESIGGIDTNFMSERCTLPKTFFTCLVSLTKCFKINN